LRIYIHDDGAIVIQLLGGTREDRILFALNSAQPVFHSPKPESQGAGFASAVQCASLPSSESSLSKM
jgi:hypothetical protein